MAVKDLVNRENAAVVGQISAIRGCSRRLTCHARYRDDIEGPMKVYLTIDNNTVIIF